jgi:hypothetical protein
MRVIQEPARSIRIWRIANRRSAVPPAPGHAFRIQGRMPAERMQNRSPRTSGFSQSPSGGRGVFELSRSQVRTMGQRGAHDSHNPRPATSLRIPNLPGACTSPSPLRRASHPPGRKNGLTQTWGPISVACAIDLAPAALVDRAAASERVPARRLRSGVGLESAPGRFQG